MFNYIKIQGSSVNKPKSNLTPGVIFIMNRTGG